MIEAIEDMPHGALGFLASGEVTAEDYEAVLMPAIEASLKGREKICLLYQLGPGFTGFSAGAMWDDAKLGFAHWSAWQKIAVVSDLEWIRTAIGALAMVLPCPVRVFPNAELAAAKRWLAE